MSIPPPNVRFRKAVRGFYAWLGALVFAGAAPFVAIKLVDSGTFAARIAGVVLGTVSWIPMVVVIAGIIRAGDEFQRRIHLIALALAFASALLLLALLDWLVRAQFMWPPPLPVLSLSFAALWLIWLIVVKRRFEREP
jgi:hypothetical protein